MLLLTASDPFQIPSNEPGEGEAGKATSGPPPPLPPAPGGPPAASPAPGAGPHSPLQRALVAALLIAAAALIGYVLSRPTDGEAADVLARTAEVATRVPEPFETDDPAAALAYIHGEFGWRVGVPVFAEARLEGVAIAPLAPAVEVPVLLYRTAEAAPLAVFIYNYALFDQVTDRLRLRRADYDALAGEEAVARRARGRDLVLWRDRADVYVAVTDLAPDRLLEGMRVAR